MSEGNTAQATGQAEGYRPKSDPRDIRRAMQMGAEQITWLRQRNAILEAKVEVMELFGAVFRTSPAGGAMGMEEDAAWLLNREVFLLDEQEEYAKRAEAAAERMPEGPCAASAPTSPESEARIRRIVETGHG